MAKKIRPLSEKDDILNKTKNKFDPNGPEFDPETGANERNLMGREIVEWVREEYKIDKKAKYDKFKLDELRKISKYVDYWDTSLIKQAERLTNTGSRFDSGKG